MGHNTFLEKAPRVISSGDGILRTYHTDEADGTVTIATSQDTSVLDAELKQRRNESALTPKGQRFKGDMTFVGSIPLTIIEKLKKEKGIDLLVDTQKALIFLNSEEGRRWKAVEGEL